MASFLEEIDEIFDIPKKFEEKSSSDDDEIIRNINSENNSSFEDKIDFLKNELELSPDTKQLEVKNKNMDTKNIIKQAKKDALETVSPSVFKEDKKESEESILDKKTSLISDDTNVEQNTSEVKPVDKPIDDIVSNDKETSKIEKNKIMAHKKEDELFWYLDYDSDLTGEWDEDSDLKTLNRFYSVKKKIITKLFSEQKELNFKELFKELRGINVKMDMDNHDINAILDKFKEVYDQRERVKNILLDCNRQYKICDEISTSMKGYLVHSFPNIKPADRRDALVHIHIRDLQSYRSDLSALKENTDLVYKLLDNAYETLSRHITALQSLFYLDPEARANNMEKMNKKIAGTDSNRGEYNKNTAKGGSTTENKKESKKTDTILNDYDSLSDHEDIKENMEESKLTIFKSTGKGLEGLFD